jgi:DNA polymerase-3 subunit delta
MEVGAFQRGLAAGRIPRLVLIHGPEPLLVDEQVARIAQRLLPDPATAALNRQVMHADTATPDAVVEAGLSLPLFGGSRLVIVRGLGAAGARVIERLRAAIDGARARPGGWPSEGVTVVLAAAGADRKSPALKLVSEAEQVEIRPPTGRAVAGWLQTRARETGLALTPSGAETLIGLVGEDLGRLAGELDKAAVFVGPDGRVTEEVVLALVGESRARRYWELSQSLEEGDRGKALRVLEQLLAAGEEPTPLLGTIVAHLRDLWRLQAGLAEGRDSRQLGSVLKQRRPDWVVERLAARAAAVGADRLETAIHRCFDAEHRMKSGGGEPRALLTALVADVAGG